MRGVYTAEALITSLATSKTVILVQAPSTAVVELYSVRLTNADVELSEQLSIGIYRVTTVGSPVGTSVTPAKHENGDANSAVTCLVDLTVEPTAYNAVAVDHEGVSNLSGYRYDPIPEERPTIPPTGAIGLRILSAPSSFNAVVQVVFREIG